MKKVEYLGHAVDNGKIKPSPGKTDAIARFPEPYNVKQLQSFVGFCSYFRNFVQNYAEIARPLTDLVTKKTPFKFNKEQS